VIDTANRYYRADRRPYVVLSIETDALTAAVRYEDPQGLYPHVYGPIDLGAVKAIRTIERDSTGRFLRITSAPHGPSLDR
jgi:uncharacterized protein (DUF952 family)